MSKIWSPIWSPGAIWSPIRSPERLVVNLVVVDAFTLRTPFLKLQIHGDREELFVLPSRASFYYYNEVCYSLNTFIFAMDNLRLDLYGNINHYAKTNFFHTCCRALRCHFFRYQYDTDTFLIYKFDTDTILILSWSEISILILILIPSRAKNRYRYWYWYFHIKLWY